MGLCAERGQRGRRCWRTWACCGPEHALRPPTYTLHPPALKHKTPASGNFFLVFLAACQISRVVIYTQGEAKIDLQFFVWKIIAQFLSSNTRMHGAVRTHSCKPAPPPRACSLMGYTNMDLVKKHPFLFRRSFHKSFESQRGEQVSGEAAHVDVGDQFECCRQQ